MRKDIVSIYGLPKNKRKNQPGISTESASKVISHDSAYRKNIKGVIENKINKNITENSTRECASQPIDLWTSLRTACQPGWLSIFISLLNTSIWLQSLPEITLALWRSASSGGRNPYPTILKGINMIKKA